MRTAVIGFVLAAAISGCGSAPHQAVSDAAPVTVPLSRVHETAVASPFEAGGVVRARATALIASRVLAPITQVHVRPGDRVRRGATLVTLDRRDFEANRAQAEASSLSAMEGTRAADADVTAAESALVIARATHDRIASLQGKRSATAQELDQAVATLSAAQAEWSGAQARRAAANAALDAARASARAVTINETYAVLAAPFDGVVVERHADRGTMAMPGTSLLTLEDPSTYRLEVQLDEARAAHVKVGQAAAVRLDNQSEDGEAWIDGRVTEIARVDAVSHSFLLKIDLPKSSALRSGLFGRARFLGPPRRALSIPSSALIRRGQLTLVYLVDAEGRARLRPISIGASDRDGVEVLAGVRQGDAVVTNPPASLVDGVRVSGVQP